MLGKTPARAFFAFARAEWRELVDFAHNSIFLQPCLARSHLLWIFKKPIYED